MDVIDELQEAEVLVEELLELHDLVVDKLERTRRRVDELSEVVEGELNAAATGGV